MVAAASTRPVIHAAQGTILTLSKILPAQQELSTYFSLFSRRPPSGEFDHGARSNGRNRSHLETQVFRSESLR